VAGWPAEEMQWAAGQTGKVPHSRHNANGWNAPQAVSICSVCTLAHQRLCCCRAKHQSRGAVYEQILKKNEQVRGGAAGWGGACGADWGTFRQSLQASSLPNVKT